MANRASAVSSVASTTNQRFAAESLRKLRSCRMIHFHQVFIRQFGEVAEHGSFQLLWLDVRIFMQQDFADIAHASRLLNQLPDAAAGFVQAVVLAGGDAHQRHFAIKIGGERVGPLADCVIGRELRMVRVGHVILLENEFGKSVRLDCGRTLVKRRS